MKKLNHLPHWKLQAKLATSVFLAFIVLLSYPILPRQTSHDTLHDEPPKAHQVENNISLPSALTFLREADDEALVVLLVDVAVDEDFIRQVGEKWLGEVFEMITGANSLLSQIGLTVRVASVQEWRSEDFQDSIANLLASAESQVHRANGRLLLAITCQDTVKYDGWAQEGNERVIVKFYHEGQKRNSALIAHEIGHLLGARHHEDDEECTGDGCVMDQKGYAHATTWCDHHQEVVEQNIQLWLSNQA